MRIHSTLSVHWLAIACIVFLSGCSLSPKKRHLGDLPVPAVPKELCKETISQYQIAPPDIVSIQLLNPLPQTPYRLRSQDVVRLEVENSLPDAPISGEFIVGLEGNLYLGPPYGSVVVAGLTEKEAEARIDTFLREEIDSPLKTPNVALAFVVVSPVQQLSGEYMLGPDGRISLGSYGTLPLIGLTLDDAKVMIEAHLSNYLKDPVVSVDIFAYNSRTYYVILEGAGLGDRVYRFPFTGNETVLDAMSLVNGTTELQSDCIWVARPGCKQVMPVDWDAITKHGKVATNYQIFPGDRIFIAEDRNVAMDTKLSKLFAPFERVMGFSLLTVETVTRFSGNVLQGGGNPRRF